ncbi:MAG: phosphatidate cytidylyltransferase [Anaerolineae bacterium]
MSVLKTRIASAAVLIPLVAILVWAGGWYLAAGLALAGVLATVEYLALVRSAGLRPTTVASLAFVPLAVLDAQLPDLGIIRWAVFLLAAASLSVEVFHSNREGSLNSWGTTVAGLYIGLGISYFVSLRALDNGLLWVGLAMVGTWISDTGAYLAGSRWGRRRLAPAISPSKSWEGVYGGLLTGVLTVWAIAWLGLGLAHWQGLVLGLVLVLAATLGDLAESVIKRQVGAKDSGALIPGHGGMLDRIDSLLFVAPAVYYMALLLTGSG